MFPQYWLKIILLALARPHLSCVRIKKPLQNQILRKTCHNTPNVPFNVLPNVLPNLFPTPPTPAPFRTNHSHSPTPLPHPPPGMRSTPFLCHMLRMTILEGPARVPARGPARVPARAPARILVFSAFFSGQSDLHNSQKQVLKMGGSGPKSLS